MGDVHSDPHSINQGAASSDESASIIRSSHNILRGASVTASMFGNSSAARQFSDKLDQAQQQHADVLAQHRKDLEDTADLGYGTAQSLQNTEENNADKLR